MANQRTLWIGGAIVAAVILVLIVMAIGNVGPL